MSPVVWDVEVWYVRGLGGWFRHGFKVTRPALLFPQDLLYKWFLMPSNFFSIFPGTHLYDGN